MKRMDEKVTMPDGTQIDIFVTQPTNKAVREADILRTKVWTQCTTDGIPTRKQVVKMMEDRGEWTQAQKDQEQELTEKLTLLEKELALGKDGKKKPKASEGRDLAIEIRRTRFALRELIAERLSMEDNSAENLADNARFDYLVANCTFYADGRRVYASYDEYNNKSADEIAFAAASVLGKMLYNLDSDFEKNLPENRFLLQYGLVNDDLSLIDPNQGFTIDTEGNRIDGEGYFVDKDGNRTDKDGNPLDVEGNYQQIEYENDLIVKPRRTRKTSKPEEQTTES